MIQFILDVLKIAFGVVLGLLIILPFIKIKQKIEQKRNTTTTEGKGWFI